MGYTIKIGQLVVTSENYEGRTYLSNDVTKERHESAPAFGEPTDFENQRWPSYSAWAEFARFVDLEGFFFDKSEGLMREHPGCYPLTNFHKERVDKALLGLYERYPDTVPSFGGEYYNEVAARLEWLKYWVDWALANCSQPVFLNT